MQLLVSVADAADATEALAGGADWIDAKDPSAGPLGRVSLTALTRITAVVGSSRPISAALGDVSSEAEAGRLAAEYGSCGVDLVKIGVSGLTAIEVTRVTAAAVSGASAATAGRTGVVAVAYADDERWSRTSGAFVSAAARAGARGVLLDTGRKDGPGLCALLPGPLIAAWVDAARRAGMLAGLAGRLTAEDLVRLAECDPDVVGIRGAACRGGRMGMVAAERVIALRAACQRLDRPARQPA